MTVRDYIYSKLLSPEIANLVGGLDDPRIFAKKTMTSSVEDHPFIVYKLGVDSNEDIAETLDISRQYFQVWVHDVNDDNHSDYGRIDEIIRAIKQVFFLANSASPQVWITTHIETSQDFNDDTLNTLFKYARFYMIKSE